MSSAAEPMTGTTGATGVKRKVDTGRGQGKERRSPRSAEASGPTPPSTSSPERVPRPRFLDPRTARSFIRSDTAVCRPCAGRRVPSGHLPPGGSASHAGDVGTTDRGLGRRWAESRREATGAAQSWGPRAAPRVCDVWPRPEGARGLKGNVSGGGGRGDGPGRGRRCRRPLGRRLSGGPGRPGRGGEVGRRLRRCGGFTGPARAVRLIWRTGNQKRDTIQSFSYII